MTKQLVIWGHLLWHLYLESLSLCANVVFSLPWQIIFHFFCSKNLLPMLTLGKVTFSHACSRLAFNQNTVVCCEGLDGGGFCSQMSVLGIYGILFIVLNTCYCNALGGKAVFPNINSLVIFLIISYYTNFWDADKHDFFFFLKLLALNNCEFQL